MKLYNITGVEISDRDLNGWKGGFDGFEHIETLIKSQHSIDIPEFLSNIMMGRGYSLTEEMKYYEDNYLGQAPVYKIEFPYIESIGWNRVESLYIMIAWMSNYPWDMIKYPERTGDNWYEWFCSWDCQTDEIKAEHVEMCKVLKFIWDELHQERVQKNNFFGWNWIKVIWIP